MAFNFHAGSKLSTYGVLQLSGAFMSLR
jgi:hypothetical protein